MLVVWSTRFSHAIATRGAIMTESIEDIHNPSEIQELGPSELGTKEYWDKTYNEGMKYFKESGVIDEGWFGEDSGIRIVKWLCSSKDVQRHSKIVDIGCGNGVLLLELAQEGFTDLTGLDYSASAIELAKAIAFQQELNIKYEVCDVLSNNLQHGSYEIALDKGTYDAISLHAENTREKRLQYIENVWRLLSENGLFVVTSCNWTESELLSQFNSKFALHHVIPTPVFKFGGSTGNLVTSVVLQKRNDDV